MIRIIHGENIAQSRLRLRSIIAQTPPENRLILSEENTYNELYLGLFSDNLFEEKTLIVCENFILQKKITLKDKILSIVPLEKNLVFWEEGEVKEKSQLAALRSAVVELFKPEPAAFRFLDSIAPGARISISSLISLDSKQKSHGLLALIASRILLLTLAKTGLDLQTVSSICGYHLQEWQWQKIRTQAAKFTTETLKAFLNGTLKADLLIKTGLTAQSEENLASLLLIKYLKV